MPCITPLKGVLSIDGILSVSVHPYMLLFANKIEF